MNKPAIFFFSFLMFLTSRSYVVCGTDAGGNGKSIARITVDAGSVDRLQTPISVELPEGLEAENIQLVEMRDGNQVKVPAQTIKGKKGGTLSWILSDKTAAGTKRVFELVKGTASDVFGVDVKDVDSALEVSCGGKAVFRYKYGIEPPPEGKDKNYAKSGFIHPVWSPSGQILTQIHPPDHIHHMGLWNAWTSTDFEGRKVDFWNIREAKGTVRFGKLIQKISGPVLGGFSVMQEHVDLSAPGGAKVALNENLSLMAWNTGGTDKSYCLFDWTSIQSCASSSPLNLHKYRYGGIGFRATAEWGKDNSNYLTSEDKTRKDGHSTRAKWCAMTGKTAKGESGILMMTHPQNHEFPEPIRIWSEKDNGEGRIFFNFCPVQQKEWTLDPGRDYVFRYRICTYDGTMSKEVAGRLWNDFGNPPGIKLEVLK